MQGVANALARAWSIAGYKMMMGGAPRSRTHNRRPRSRPGALPSSRAHVAAIRDAVGFRFSSADNGFARIMRAQGESSSGRRNAIMLGDQTYPSARHSEGKDVIPKQEGLQLKARWTRASSGT